MRERERERERESVLSFGIQVYGEKWGRGGGD